MLLSMFFISPNISHGDCIATAGTIEDLPKNSEDSLGLISGHCYCITRVITTDTVDSRWRSSIKSSFFNFEILGEIYLGKAVIHTMIARVGHWICRDSVPIICIGFNTPTMMMVSSGCAMMISNGILKACKGLSGG